MMMSSRVENLFSMLLVNYKPTPQKTNFEIAQTPPEKPFFCSTSPNILNCSLYETDYMNCQYAVSLCALFELRLYNVAF